MSVDDFQGLEHYLYFPNFLRENSPSYNVIRDTSPLQQEQSKVWGKIYDQKRQTCIMGIKESTFYYSGFVRQIHVISQEARQILDQVNEYMHSIEPNQPLYQNVIVNHYETGTSKIGAHSDKERKYAICSITLLEDPNQPRTFVIESIAKGKTGSKQKFKIKLPHGSLFVMKPGFQEIYKHSVNEEPDIITGRINMTFRIPE